MKKDTLERFAYLETQLYWGGGITAGELARAFGLARQTAQGTIDHYRRLHPGNLEFNASKKRHVARQNFASQYVRAGASEFLDALRGEMMIAHYREIEDWSSLSLHDADRLLRPALRQDPIHVVLSALRKQHAVTMEYQSKLRMLSRDFSPNHLIFSDNRYHVRGYCHVTRQYLDFVMSRIVHAEPSPEAWFSAHDDTDWNQIVKLRFRPNPQLPEEAQLALSGDHALDQDGLWTISCRKAIAYYLKRELLRVDSDYGCSRWVDSV